MSEVMLISDAAKEVNVENHVLRYWEEELHLPIKRNELGHRYYTNEDVERFKQIKSMKERGLQLKAIKMILKNGKIDILSEQSGTGEKKQANESGIYLGGVDVKSKCSESGANSRSADTERECAGRDRNMGGDASGVHMAIDIVDSRDATTQVAQESKEDKARRLQWLLQQLIRETLQENNRQLCNDIKESVVKEMDYQFRAQEEREEERNRKQIERDDAYYKKMDELLRQKGEKKKRHFIF